jgi:hypothetical protein
MHSSNPTHVTDKQTTSMQRLYEKVGILCDRIEILYIRSVIIQNELKANPPKKTVKT